ncbi:MAG: hypothetical protein HRU17_09485 [Polyangiaceae bacterium]|nr:hypothetical protein [Polyangiaceae bacterium]
MKLVVVGAGAAGTASAWAASSRADVIVLCDRDGDTALAGGALLTGGADDVPLSFSETAAVTEFFEKLNYWRLQPDRVVSDTGMLLACAGLTDWQLPASRFDALQEGATVGVVAWGTNESESRLLARALREQLAAQGLHFEAIAIAGAGRWADTPSADIAGYLDTAPGFAELEAGLKTQCEKLAAALFPPVLGVAENLGTFLEKSLSLPCGEWAGALRSTAGHRFASRRDALFQAVGVEMRGDRAESLARTADGWKIEFRGGGSLLADRIVLACGGLASGGIRLGSSAETLSGAPAASLSWKAPGDVVLDGTHVSSTGAASGLDLSHLGLDALQRIGLQADRAGGLRAPGLFGAGALLAGRPRTLLEAVVSGLAAGSAAITHV